MHITGLWSISRGLARGLSGQGEYKRMLDLADTPRRGDVDGRGNLSLQSLEQFVEWFLRVALDQVEFMTGLFDFEGLRLRLREDVLRDLQLRPDAEYRMRQAVEGKDLRGGGGEGLKT